MGRVGRDVYRRKLERHLSHGIDEDVVSLIARVVGAQAGSQDALLSIADMPREALNARLGSPHYIPPWTIETLVNELLTVPKLKDLGLGRTRVLDARRFHTLKVLISILVKLENAEDGVFLEKHHVLAEMARIAQRQFPWQRGVANAPHLYRSMLLYGKGSAREYFEADAGLSLPDFVKVGATLSGALRASEIVSRNRDLSQVGIVPEVREAALAKLAIPIAEARNRASALRKKRHHAAYSPSILRDYPIIAFGAVGERLRAPLPELIMYRYTSGLYLDVVKGGAAVWTDIGRRFETYVLEYLQAMMSPFKVTGEIEYGLKRHRFRSPDIFVAGEDGIVAVVECKAKRMTFDARYADDPVTAAALGFDELAKGIFQIWRFFAHVRQGLTGTLQVARECQGVIVTADSWLMMADSQAKSVVEAAHALADSAGNIKLEDRREIAFCQIDDVEFSLQHGSADSFLTACREISSGEKKGYILSVAHRAEQDGERPYPFLRRIPEVLPWMADPLESI